MDFTLYCSVLVLSVGGCIGSFLNVVIYRWPRGISTRHPSRSFCPSCEHPIRWRDNIPVLSYILLRSRCRHCHRPISLQYPLVELATALAFLIIYDAFFVTSLREGVGEVSADWPLLIAHLVLAAGLIALSVMDLESYIVDINLTWLVSLVGILGHAFWTPRASQPYPGATDFDLGGQGGWIRPETSQAAMALAVAVGLAIGWFIYLRGRHLDVAEEHVDATQAEPPTPLRDIPSDLAGPPLEKGVLEESQPQGQDQAPLPVQDVPPRPAQGTAQPLPTSGNYRWLGLIPLTGLLVAYVVLMLMEPSTAFKTRLAQMGDWPWIGRLLQPMLQASVLHLVLGVLACFVGLSLAASHPQPEADSEIVDAIWGEAPSARAMAIDELRLLGPAILLGLLALTATWFSGGRDSQSRVFQLLHWQPIGQWQPLWGLATGLVGWVIGGAIGWLSRIFFTLAFGKEALGMGDVHIMAAAGAVAGWPVVFLGFFLAAPLALLALVVIAIRRQARALPYGPWLALGFFIALIFQDTLLKHLRIRWLFE
ncbi:MAG: A24 family peptidase [Phycisphaerae bacterium]|nr:A24 family peptidase [Phycisphaerae bacterium]